MGKECNREDAAKTDSVANNKANGDKLLGGLVGDVEEEREVLSLSDDNNYPDATFFKCGVGFLAWYCGASYPFTTVQACNLIYLAMPKSVLQLEERRRRELKC